jgi:hypothetical protein
MVSGVPAHGDVRTSTPFQEATMAKLTLDVEELRVQSFVTDDADGLKGTVQGQEDADPSRLLSRCCQTDLSRCCQTDEFPSCAAPCTP